jgi:hypothetical protein
MALIEYLEKDDWREFLEPLFSSILKRMKQGDYDYGGSATDDLWGWLGAGGVSRVKHHLAKQMRDLRFPADKQAELLACVEQLALEHRLSLLELIGQGRIRAPQEEWLAACHLTQAQFDEALPRLLAGEKPFGEPMAAHGHSAEEIAALHHIIDEWIDFRRRVGVFPRLPKRRAAAPKAARQKKH